MHGLEPEKSTAERFESFAKEVRKKSSRYEQLCSGVATDPEVLALLDRLPPRSRQPNLLLAAVRYLFGTPYDYAAFRAVIQEHWTDVEATLLTRRTQTNEPGRCALYLPVLAALPQPLALLEVGASAGLCLLPDRYGYDYGGHRVGVQDGSAPVFPCRPSGEVSLPDRLPYVTWRRGIDLDPLDLSDDADAEWLRALVWPEETDRLARLDAAIESARRDPPLVTKGDLLEAVEDVAATAPADACLVILHTAVLAYLPAAARDDFAARVSGLDATWLSIEAPAASPGGTQRWGEPHDGEFLLVRDGDQLLATCDSHGSWLGWL